jgi:hypothetical protein
MCVPNHSEAATKTIAAGLGERPSVILHLKRRNAVQR